MHLMKSDEAFHYARAVIRDDKGDLAQRRGIIGAPQWMPGGVLYRYDFLDKWTFILPRKTKGDLVLDIYVTPGPGLEDIHLSTQTIATLQYSKGYDVTINMDAQPRWLDGRSSVDPWSENSKRIAAFDKPWDNL
jgi:hypothetical protein